MAQAQLVITELDEQSAIELVARNHVGRLAFGFHDRVDIEPISYVYADGWIYARTSPGTKLLTITHHPYVAMEVDEIRDRFHWRSVVMRGTIYFLNPERGGHEATEHAHAVEILRSADSTAFTEEDVAPHRRTVFRIHVDEITGRVAGA